MGKRKDAKNASDSVDTFLTLMRNLEIVIMNCADFSKRQMVKLEEKMYQIDSEFLKMRANNSSLLSLITQKSDKALAELEQDVSNMNTEFANLLEVDFIQKHMKMTQEIVDDVINRVYSAPLITSSSNPSRDLCSSFFKQFQLLEDNIDWLGKFDCQIDLSLRKISVCQSKLMKITLGVSSLINPPSADQNKNDAADS